MNDFYDLAWFDARWQSMPPVMRKLAADTIHRALGEEDIVLIKAKHEEYGPHEWIHNLIDVPEEDLENWRKVGMLDSVSKTYSAHHGFGTAIRNLLRDEELGAGIRDEDLPEAPYEDGSTHCNWDDFYVSAIEAACGLRDV